MKTNLIVGLIAIASFNALTARADDILSTPIVINMPSEAPPANPLAAPAVAPASLTNPVVLDMPQSNGNVGQILPKVDIQVPVIGGGSAPAPASIPAATTLVPEAATISDNSQVDNSQQANIGQVLQPLNLGNTQVGADSGHSVAQHNDSEAAPAADDSLSQAEVVQDTSNINNALAKYNQAKGNKRVATARQFNPRQQQNNSQALPVGDSNPALERYESQMNRLSHNYSTPVSACEANLAKVEKDVCQDVTQLEADSINDGTKKKAIKSMERILDGHAIYASRLSLKGLSARLSKGVHFLSKKEGRCASPEAAAKLACDITPKNKRSLLAQKEIQNLSDGVKQLRSLLKPGSAGEVMMGQAANEIAALSRNQAIERTEANQTADKKFYSPLASAKRALSKPFNQDPQVAPDLTQSQLNQDLAQEGAPVQPQKKSLLSKLTFGLFGKKKQPVQQYQPYVVPQQPAYVGSDGQYELAVPSATVSDE